MKQQTIILVAEDSDDIRLLLKLMLEGKGYGVVEAANGREAVAAATRERPDLILMDLNMPVMDGIAATRYLREQPETSAVPIIAVTAHCSEPSWRARAMDAGCVRCVGKPVDFELLGSLISEELN
ncbi:MAG TPA: response regulator [Pyrinomonadaceae bacterium]|nr:response regulator [Pyrinomonadaceae bacterium]